LGTQAPRRGKDLPAHWLGGVLSDFEDDDTDNMVIARRQPPSHDRVETVCRWGGLLVALGLLAYAALIISQV